MIKCLIALFIFDSVKNYKPSTEAYIDKPLDWRPIVEIGMCFFEATLITIPIIALCWFIDVKILKKQWEL